MRHPVGTHLRLFTVLCIVAAVHPDGGFDLLIAGDKANPPYRKTFKPEIARYLYTHDDPTNSYIVGATL